MMIPTVTRAQLTRQHTEPKTILGFFLAFFALFSAAAVGVVIALVATGHGGLAAAVLVAGFLTAIGILVWVARAQSKDPTALMLGQVTADDYLAFQQWTAGDSVRGERSALPAGPGLVGIPVAALPPPGHESMSSDAEASETPIPDGPDQGEVSAAAPDQTRTERPDERLVEPDEGES